MRKMLVLSFVLAAALSYPQVKREDVVGKWTGKIRFDLTKLPKNATKEQIGMYKKLAETMLFTLNFGKDGAYSGTVTGPNNEKDSSAGTWSMDKGKIKVIDTMRHGKPVEKGKQKAELLGVQKKGKELWLTIPSGPVPTTLVLNRSK